MDRDIELDPVKDQFLLTDLDIVKKIIASADLSTNDSVLEIGAGTGNLTRELAKKAGRVIAFEIDKRFDRHLDELPDNVEVHSSSVLRFMGKNKDKSVFNKIVCNPPYRLLEPILHKLISVDYDKTIIMVPKSISNTIKSNVVFGSFFIAKPLVEVPRSCFTPQPSTDSVVVDLIKYPDPLVQKDLSLFLRQYLYKHEGQKSRNALVEGLIVYSREALGRMMTKNQARSIIANSDISTELLEDLPDNPGIYKEVSDKLPGHVLS